MRFIVLFALTAGLTLNSSLAQQIDGTYDGRFDPESPYAGYCNVHIALRPVLEGRAERSVIRASTVSLPCGNFSLEFEADTENGGDWGFNDSVEGAARRDCACEVLQYIESVIDVAVDVGAGDDPIVIQFNPSLDDAASGTLASAAPNFPASLTSAYYSGDLFQHMTTGVDPDSGTPDGFVTVNFGHDYAVCGEPLGDCQFDLFTVLLHEFTHAMGFISFVNDTGTTIESIAAPTAAFSQMDELFLYYDDAGTFEKVVDIALYTGSGGINPLPGLSVTSNKIWMTNTSLTGAQTNDPVNSMTSWSGGTSMSHFDGKYWPRAWESPGFPARYVMNGFINTGEAIQAYSLQELRWLQDFGFALQTSYVDYPTVTNTPPFTLDKFVTSAVNSYPNLNLATTDLYFNVDSCGSITIDLDTGLASDGTILGFTDDDGDPISIYPDSLYNIRGCGNGYNNHDQLTVVGNTITFAPRQDFIGRAQYAFELYDGIERGSYIVVTIDVDKSLTCFDNGPAELVLNGGFEEGVEQKTNTTPNVPSTYLPLSSYAYGFQQIDTIEYRGPFWFEVVSRDSWRDCRFGDDSLGNVGASYLPGGMVLPAIPGTNRYVNLLPPDQFAMRLAEPLMACTQYLFSCDVYFYEGNDPSMDLEIKFTDIFANWAPANDTLNITVTDGGGWNFVTTTFIYSGLAPSEYLVLDFTDVSFDRYHFDNISIIEDTGFVPPLTVDAGPDETICPGSPGVTLTATVVGSAPISSYEWSPGTGLSATTIANPTANPTVTTTYQVIVTDTDGCQAIDYVTVLVDPDCICEVTADWTWNATGCTVDFTNLSTSNSITTITGYSWNFGDGSPLDTAASPTHTFTGTGSYTVCLTVTGSDTFGGTCSDTLCATVTVDCVPPCEVTPNFAFTDNLCEVSFTDFTIAGSGTVITDWEWDFGDASPILTGVASPTHTYAASGVYTVCLTVTGINAAGTICKKTVCRDVQVDCPKCDVHAGFNWTGQGCNLSFFDLSIAGAGTTTTGWSWDFGDGGTSTLQNPTHTFSGSGTYTICLTVFGVDENGNPCSDTFCTTLDVSCGCEAAANFSYTVASDGCTYDFTDLSVITGGTAASWSWDFGDGGTSTLQNPTHTFSGSGVYTVCLTVLGTAGNEQCEDKVCFDIEVQCQPPCELTPTFNVFQSINKCTISFVDTTVAGAGTTITGWFWDFGDGSTSTLENPLHSYTGPGTYIVCLTVFGENGGVSCQATVCMNIQVFCHSKPPCKIKVSFTKYQTFGATTMSFDSGAASTGTITGYFWDFGDGNTSTLPDPTHTYAGPGLYYVCLTVYATSGFESCYKTFCKWVKVNSPTSVGPKKKKKKK